jgi:hypothetical protein
MWRWRVEKISWTERAKNEEMFHVAKEDRNILLTIRRGQANWICHILRGTSLLKHVIEGRVSGKSRRGRRREQLLDELKEKRRHWSLKEEALIALSGVLAVAEAVVMSEDRVRSELICNPFHAANEMLTTCFA